MTLDIQSERGQATLTDERAAAALYEQMNPGWSYISTNKDRPVVADGFLCKDAEIKAVVETKCRYGFTCDQFWNAWNGRWLITEKKLRACAELAKTLEVPLVGFLYIVDEGVLLTKRIADERGNYLTSIEIGNTETQRSVNGGTAVRSNAFIDMTDAKEWRR